MCEVMFSMGIKSLRPVDNLELPYMENAMKQIELCHLSGVKTPTFSRDHDIKFLKGHSFSHWGSWPSALVASLCCSSIIFCHATCWPQKVASCWESKTKRFEKNGPIQPLLSKHQVFFL